MIELAETPTLLTGIELIEERLANALAAVAELSAAIDTALPGDYALQFELAGPAYGARQRLLVIAAAIEMQTSMPALPAGITISEPAKPVEEVK